MKTQIIQLNQNDDYISVRDRMSWSQAGRILLVWPDHGHVLNRRLDLKLALRHAASMGAQLALVTQDIEVRFNASQLGIAVFNNPRLAQETPWSTNLVGEIKSQDHPQHANLIDLQRAIHLKTPIWLEHPATKVFCLVISVLALFALGIFILPGAKIILTPQVKDQSMVFNLIADPSSNAINYSSGSLPTYFKEVIVEASGTIPATGSVTIPASSATGELSFTNESDQIISIPARTVVSTLDTNPIRFITTSLSDTAVEPDTSVIITAQATKPGLSGNLPPDTLVEIMGEPEPGLTVTNPMATLGGTDASVTSPTAEDLSSLRQQMTNRLLQEALVEMRSTLPGDDILITPTITNVETLSETSFPSIGEPGNQLELSLRFRAQCQVISGGILSSLVNPIMDSNTPPGYSPLANSLEITPLSNPAIDHDRKAHWTIRVTRKLQAAISTQNVAELIRGRSIAQASQSLSSALPLAGQARIILTPTWWPWLPFLPMRTEVIQAGEP